MQQITELSSSVCLLFLTRRPQNQKFWWFQWYTHSHSVYFQVVQPNPAHGKRHFFTNIKSKLTGETGVTSRLKYENLFVYVSWKCANLSLHILFQLLKGHDDHVITCLQFSGTRIVSGSDDNTLKVWSAISGKVYLYECAFLVWMSASFCIPFSALKRWLDILEECGLHRCVKIWL